MKFLPELFESNRAWARAQVEGDPAYFSKLCDIHDPDLLWIGCSDSRVPANAIVGRAPGELFVHRNIANVVPLTDINVQAVLDYAVHTLRIRHIIVCGHYHCGGIKAALGEAGESVSDLWLQGVRALATEHAAELDALPTFEQRWDRLCELNVAAQVRNVTLTDTVRTAWKRGEPLAVHGWIYDLKDGLLRDLGITEGTIAE